jgi:hypothetical protein
VPRRQAVVDKKIGLGGNTYRNAIAFERHCGHLFRTPIGLAIGGVEEVDAGLEADVDEEASPTSVWLKALKTHLYSPNVVAPQLSPETLSPKAPASR